MEWRPSVTTRAGSRISSWRFRYGAQAATSSGSGSRLSGGRHLTTFVMKTSSRRHSIEPRSLTSRSPARPMNGRPRRSSLKPGASPTRTTSVSGLPSPGTALVRPSASRQRVHVRTSDATASSAARRSAWVMPGPRSRSPPRGTARHPGRRPSEPSRAAIERLRDLDRVRRGALAEVVADDPERDPAIASDRRILADPPDEDVVGAGSLGRQRVGRGGGVVLDDDAVDGREQLAGAIGCDRGAGLDVDRLGVGHEDRDADGRAGHAEIGEMEDLATLFDDLPLFLGVAVGQEDVDLRQRVERDLVGVDRRALRLAGDVGADLAFELADRLAARAGYRLVRVDDHALEADAVAQRHQDRDELHRRAVRVGDDPGVALEVAGVHLADDEGDRRVHPPGR